MRARLEKMAPDDTYTFLCVPAMAKEMEQLIPVSGGLITLWETRSYGIVMKVKKT